MRAIPDCAYDFIKGPEACKLTAYRDSAGVWTVGYGHTGPEVTAGLSISTDTARSYLADDLKIAAARLAARVAREAIDGLSEHQYAALLSFVFNLGAGDWTIWKVINAGRLAGVPAQIMRFTKVKDAQGDYHEVPGLVNRRSAEVALWNTADRP